MFDLEKEVRQANKSVPEAVCSELYNAALEAIDNHEAASRVDYYSDNSNVLPSRLYTALKDWTNMEYRRHWGMK